MLLAILLLAVFAIGSSLQLTRSSGVDSGCEAVQEAHEQVSIAEDTDDVATAAAYEEVAGVVRRSTVDVAPAVAQDLLAMSDAYLRLADLVEGFRADDASTYVVLEENVEAIEAQQVVIDANLPKVRAWLDSRCG